MQECGSKTWVRDSIVLAMQGAPVDEHGRMDSMLRRSCLARMGMGRRWPSLAEANFPLVESEKSSHSVIPYWREA